MPGIAKRKFVGELIRFNKKLKRPLNLIFEVLPIDYDKNTILQLFKELYPFEWQEIEQRYKHYREKDEFLVKHKKKARYKPEHPEKYFFNLQKVKHILSEGSKIRHKKLYNEKLQMEKLEHFRNKRRMSNDKKTDKVAKAKELIQDVEPLFIDIFITSYHNKGITTQGKMEIIKELQKYDCEKTMRFFSKLNDSERNNQIRRMAFFHLQKLGNYVKLRKNFKGKIKSYMTEKDDFCMTPEDLVKRIENDSIQNKKEFDVFISHSYKDSALVKKIKKSLNKKDLNIYCDWTSDNDFLKRDMAGQFTEQVLKKRIEQSRYILFVRTENTTESDNSIKSKWIQMELEHSKKLNKKIYCIDLINNGTSVEFESLEYDNENEEINWRG